MRGELAAITAQTTRPYNVNFFCHTPPIPNPEREAAWRAALWPYYNELGIDPSSIKIRQGRVPFGPEAADVLGEFGPPVVSFHFGLHPEELMARVKDLSSKILASATSVEEALWLEARGVDVVIAQGLEAGGHRGIFLSEDLSTQLGLCALLPQIVQAVSYWAPTPESGVLAREAIFVPEMRRPVQAVLVAEDGNVWLGMTQLAQEGGRGPRPATFPGLEDEARGGGATGSRWVILSPEGEPLARVSFPPRFLPMWIQGERVVGVTVGGLGENYVIEFRLGQATTP